MYSVYIIQSRKTKGIYIGFTANLKQRILSHNNRENFATKNKIPWELVYCEVYRSRKDALEREKGLKYYGRALAQLKKRIKGSFLEA